MRFVHPQSAVQFIDPGLHLLSKFRSIEALAHVAVASLGVSKPRTPPRPPRSSVRGPPSRWAGLMAFSFYRKPIPGAGEGCGRPWEGEVLGTGAGGWCQGPGPPDLHGGLQPSWPSPPAGGCAGAHRYGMSRAGWREREQGARGSADPASLAQVWLSLWRCVTMETVPTPSTTPLPRMGRTQWPSSMLTRRFHAGKNQFPAPTLR